MSTRPAASTSAPLKKALTKKRTSPTYRLLLLWEQPKYAAVMAFAAYLIFAKLHGPVMKASALAYFNYLADAFLHGSVSLVTLPPNVLDLSQFNGHYFLYWPPLPALLLMPFVGIFGVGFSDVLFTVVIGALNVSLVALLLRVASARGIATSRERRALLVLFFAFGTVHLTLAPLGRVWFTAQVIAFLFVVLAYIAALKYKGFLGFGLTGLAIAGALLTRNHLILAALFPFIFLLKEHYSEGLKKEIRYLWVGAMPVIGAIGLFALYNWLRFNNPLDNGLNYHAMHPAFMNAYKEYGPFSIHYVPLNFFYQFLAYPFPLRQTSLYGGSLFLLSPVFFAAFWSLKARRPWIVVPLVITVLLVATPILLLMGTGWVQFGPRYSLDFICPLILLTVLGSRYWSDKALMVLTVISIIQYVVGTLALSSVL